MKSINPKCKNEDSFKYSILISLYYYELNIHREREREKQLEKHLNNYNFESNNYDTFENNNPFISLRLSDENGKILHKSLNNK